MPKNNQTVTTDSFFFIVKWAANRQISLNQLENEEISHSISGRKSGINSLITLEGKKESSRRQDAEVYDVPVSRKDNR